MTVAVKILADEAARLTAMTAHDRSIMVEAGAGSGKTAIMAGRIVLLLLDGAPPNSIAAVTFTELAASELLARVRDFVDELLDGQAIPRELRLAIPNPISIEQRTHLEEAAASIDEITCSTIHGFCQRLIKPYPVEAKIDPGASLMDPGQAELAFDDILDQWLRETLEDESECFVAELVFQNPASAVQLVRDVAAQLRRHRVLSSPASSALRPLARAFRDAVAAYGKFLGESAAQEEESIELAARMSDMADGLDFAMESDGPAATVRLLVSVAHPQLCKNDGSFRAYRKKGKWGAAAKAAGLSKGDGDDLNNKAEELHLACCSAWTQMVRTAAGRVLAELLIEIQPVCDRFREYKHSAALLDFDDLIFSARDLIRDCPEVRTALSERYRHILVDEFQDTDPLQTEIFWRLCGDPVQAQDPDAWTSFKLRPGALFLVGDPKQAIYRFRGADVSAYLRAREAIRLQEPENLLSISTNFRSCAGILSYVNTRFEPHMSADGQPGFTALDAFHPDPISGLCVAALEVACAGADGKASSEHQRDCEADTVAEMCARLIGSYDVADHKAGIPRICRPGDIALLAPTGTDLWRYEEALERRGVPVATQAGKGFYRRQEIQDLISITRVLADGRDTLALGALLRGPLVGLTEEQLLDLVWSQPKNSDYPEAIPRLNINFDPSFVADPLARDIFERLQSLRKRINSTTPHQLISEAIDSLRVRPLLLQRHRGQADRALANVDLYLSLAAPYGSRGLKAFAEAMTAAWEGKTAAAEGRPDAQEEAVSLYTIHASKGLEWPIVVPINTMTKVMATSGAIVNREEQRLYLPVLGVEPAGYADACDAEMAELNRERTRLWYVAATRARELLVLPRHNVAARSNSWNALIDLDLDRLPAIDLSARTGASAAQDIDPPSLQSREVFAAEALAIVSATTRLEWLAPSRGEGPSAASEPLEGLAAVFAPDGEGALPPSKPSTKIQGGRERGLIIHKLLEEVLTGETLDGLNELEARAEHLIADLGAQSVSDPSLGLCAGEIARVILSTLLLPEIASVRPMLVPEFPVFAMETTDGVETATAGTIDALVVDQNGRPLVAIDWKSDVKPSPETAEHYRKQVRRYLEVTGAAKGLIVFVTSGELIEVTRTRNAA
ncbi:UvrD-helicase domain-containing protein [Devosia sp. 919]|uniref:UvrD-helicase domain-containing protein n=1 Tax=Devosia sp. 919 TaxID=2726065 RepID=UPI001557AB0A|nr:UvrD-helicase domain-containing protein [Devosia sp. 919]